MRDYAGEGCFLKKPPFPRTPNPFQELSKNKTVIMIAHRLSTIQGCDNIIVLENGRIAEQGDHGELLQKNGIYQKMWKDYQSSVSWKVGENHA